MVSEVTARFRLISDAGDPDEVSEHLGLEPTDQHIAGQPRPGRRSPLIWTESLWAIDSVKPGAASLDEHMCHLLDILESKGRALRALCRSGWQAEFFVGIFVDSGQGTEWLSADTLARLRRTGARVILDVYASTKAPSDGR